MTISNLLLITGTVNKSGKTTLVGQIIEQFRDSGIIGIKITPHFHETICYDSFQRPGWNWQIANTF